MAKENLAKLAKTTSLKKKDVETKGKPQPKSVVEIESKPKASINLVEDSGNRDEMAKKMVSELLKDVEIPLDKSTEEQSKEIELVENELPIDPNNYDWLTEQISTLTDENEKLISELEYYRNETQNEEYYRGSNLNEDNKNKIEQFFNELQNNFLGVNQQRVQWKDVSVKYVVYKLLDIFPFLEEHRKM